MSLVGSAIDGELRKLAKVIVEPEPTQASCAPVTLKLMRKHGGSHPAARPGKMVP